MEDTLALIARNIDVVIHEHNAPQLVVSLDVPFDGVIGGERLEGSCGCLIAANIAHACQTRRSTMLVISIDGASSRGRYLSRQILAGRPYIRVEELFPAEVVDDVRKRYREQGVKQFDALALVRHLCKDPVCLDPLDTRVNCAMEMIRSRVQDLPSVGQIAAAVKLSERRLRQLFRAQAGIPIASYMLWARIRRALQLIAANEEMRLAEVAVEAGFADQAHLTRTFKRMFGVTPAMLRENSRMLWVFP